MTKREAFDIVRRHLLRQQARSYSASDMCVYRARDGKKCAIGALISDEEYTDAMEGNSVVVLNARYHFWPDSWLDMLHDLQKCHDAYPVSDWPARLAEIERDWAL